jgi:hypothetical protein
MEERRLTVQVRKSIREQIEASVTKLAEVESSGNAEAVQKAYEKLFALCHDKHLDLTALLREAEESRHANGRVMSPDATSPV